MLSTLPDELLLTICTNLSIQEVFNLQFVNKRLAAFFHIARVELEFTIDNTEFHPDIYFDGAADSAADDDVNTKETGEETSEESDTEDNYSVDESNLSEELSHTPSNNFVTKEFLARFVEYFPRVRIQVLEYFGKKENNAYATIVQHITEMVFYPLNIKSLRLFQTVPKITIIDCDIPDCELLVQVKELELYATSVVDFSKLKNLHSIVIARCDWVVDATTIAHIDKIELEDINIKNFSALGNQKELSLLDILLPEDLSNLDSVKKLNIICYKCPTGFIFKVRE